MAIIGLLRAIALYLIVGLVILMIQSSNTPCADPAVLDDGSQKPASADDWRIARDVVFWAPRFISFVVIGETSIKNFLLARQCVGDGRKTP